MDAQRRALLDTVMRELTAPRPRTRPRDPNVVPTRRTKGPGLKHAVAGALLAGGSLLAFPSTAAHAEVPAQETASVVVQEDDCFIPNFVAESHTKGCGWGYAFVHYDYMYTYSPNGILRCHVFDAWYYGCGGAADIGPKDRCGY